MQAPRVRRRHRRLEHWLVTRRAPIIRMKLTQNRRPAENKFACLARLPGALPGCPAPGSQPRAVRRARTASSAKRHSVAGDTAVTPSGEQRADQRGLDGQRGEARQGARAGCWVWSSRIQAFTTPKRLAQDGHAAAAAPRARLPAWAMSAPGTRTSASTPPHRPPTRSTNAWPMMRLWASGAAATSREHHHLRTAHQRQRRGNQHYRLGVLEMCEPAGPSARASMATTPIPMPTCRPRSASIHSTLPAIRRCIHAVSAGMARTPCVRLV